MRQLSEPAATRRYARKFALIWRVLAVAVLLVAAVLTMFVVAVRDQTPKIDEIGVFGDYRGAAVARLVIDAPLNQWTIYGAAWNSARCVAGEWPVLRWPGS